MPYHAGNEVVGGFSYENGRWLFASPSFNKGLYGEPKDAQFSLIPSDILVTSQKISSEISI